LANALEDRHPDHGRGAELMHRAAFLSGLVKIETRAIQSQVKCKCHGARRLFTMAYRIDGENQALYSTSADLRKSRLRPLRRMSTQFHQPDEAAETPQTPISTPEFLMHLKARDVAMGRLVGVKSGEGFEVKRPPVVERSRHAGLSPMQEIKRVDF